MALSSGVAPPGSLLIADASARRREENQLLVDLEQGLRQVAGTAWGCGFVAGFAVTGLLNPWDRALYLSVVNKTPFLSRNNWRQPYHGLTQTLFQRSVSSGLYFPLEEQCSQALGSHLLGGQAAGVILAAILNPLHLIKYQSWGCPDERRSFLGTARQLVQGAGPFVFLRGAMSSVCRDATFGLCFSLRKLVEDPTSPSANFGNAVACAALGTVLSSPFNYVRNLSYAASSKEELESLSAKLRFQRKVLGGLFAEAKSKGSTLEGLRFLQQTMRLGWGTARVAIGMALSDTIYKACSRHFG